MLFLCEFVFSNECNSDHDACRNIYTDIWKKNSCIVVERKKAMRQKELVAIINHCEHKNYNKHFLQFGIELFVWQITLACTIDHCVWRVEYIYMGWNRDGCNCHSSNIETETPYLWHCVRKTHTKVARISNTDLLANTDDQRYGCISIRFL